MPTGIAPHKEIAEDPGAEERARLARAASEGLHGMSVSDIELRRAGPSYAVETLEELRAQEPDAGLVWLLGADAALGFGSWRSPERIAQLAALGVAERDGVSRPQVEQALAQAGFRFEGGEASPAAVDLAPGTAVPIEMPRVDISSSMVRQRVREGRPIGDLVPDGVAEAVARGGLYGG